MPIHAALLPVLVLCVILVNGWTDAPNAIATAVGSGALAFRPAVALAAVCNFAGVALACLCFPAVAATMENLVRFSSPQATQAGLCGALLAVILWGVAAWRFGLPTSESHALLAGLSGAALALGADIQPSAWAAVGVGLVLSLPAGVVAGRAVCCGLGRIPHNPMVGQRVAAALTAFLHGAQDGQKFLALLLMAQGVSAARPPLPARQARQARGHQHHPVYTSAFHGAKVTKGAGCAKWQTPRRHPAAPRTRIRTSRPACANMARRDGDFSQVSSPPGNSGTFSAVFTQKFWQNKKIYYFCNRKRKTKVP